MLSRNPMAVNTTALDENKLERRAIKEGLTRRFEFEHGIPRGNRNAACGDVGGNVAVTDRTVACLDPADSHGHRHRFNLIALDQAKFGDWPPIPVKANVENDWEQR